jgi:hypothetical protein
LQSLGRKTLKKIGVGWGIGVGNLAKQYWKKPPFDLEKVGKSSFLEPFPLFVGSDPKEHHHPKSISTTR